MPSFFNTFSAHVAAQPSAVALSGNGKHYSYAALDDQIEMMCLRLEHLNPAHLGLWMENGPDWVIVQLSAMKLQISVTPIPTFFSQQQVKHVLQRSGCDLLFSDQDERLGNLGVECQQMPATTDFGQYRLGRSDRAEQLHPCTVLVTYTSGTTGQPKGVCIGKILIDQICESLHSATSDIKVKRHVCLLPLAVMLEHFAGVLLPLYSGAEVIVDRAETTGLTGSGTLNTAQLAAYLQQTQPESLILTPELLQLLRMINAQGADLSSLKFVAVGGGKVSQTLLEQAWMEGIPVYEGYGLSECGSVVCLNLPGAVKQGTAGKPLGHTSIRVNAQGEILVSGPTMLGYLGEPAFSASEFATGDLGYRDADGFLHISGRSKNVQINSFGRNFNPEWIESELKALPGVMQCAVFGDQKPFISAVVQPMPQLSDEQVQGLINLMNAQLPDYARVKAWLRADEPFSPMNGELTNNGRIRRVEIEQHYAQRLSEFYPIHA